MFLIGINTLFARGLTSHRGGPGLIPGQDMSILGPLVWEAVTP
jgi:hypothetical protein